MTMFRMEFQSLDDVEEADEPCSSTGGNDEGNSANSAIDELQCRQDTAAESKESQAPKIHEGRVGEGPECSVSTNDSLPKNWVEVDLINFESPKPGAAQQTQPLADPVVITDLVKPFAESVNINDTNSIHSTRSSTSFSDTSDADSSSFRGRGNVKDEEKGSPAIRAYNRAFNKIMHKKSEQEGSIKSWDEPLLAAHEQAKLQRKFAKEAKRDAEIQQRELLELANPKPESALNHHLKKDHGVRKGIQKLFHIHGGTHSNQNSPKETAIGDVRESKLVMPRKGLIESSLMSPSTTSSKDITLSRIRTAPRPTARKDITFATVESNQRDVQPWTMEEYMAKNARQAEWGNRVNDEEFGGIDGNQLLNQYFDNDVQDDIDSDSD